MARTPIFNTAAIKTAIQNASYSYAADAQASDAYAITLTPAPTAYAAGQVFYFKANTANTGASSLNVNSLGAKTIKKETNQDTETGDIIVGSIVAVLYDGTNMQMLSEVAAALALQAEVQNGQFLYAADAGSTDAYAVTLSPAPTAYTTGMVVNFKANTANTGAATLNVNSLGAITILKNHDTALADNDIEVGQLVTVIYDGTNFQMQSQIANTASAGFSAVKVLNATYDLSSVSGTQNIAHGLGKVPSLVRITTYRSDSQGTGNSSTGAYDGTTNACSYLYARPAAGSIAGNSANIIFVNQWNGGGDDTQIANATLTSTNVVLAWTKTGSTITGTLNMIIEVLG